MKATEHKTTGEKMDIYEVSYLIVPSITEEKVENEVKTIHSILEAAGASVIAEEFPQFMPLAYSMDHSMDSKKHTFKEGYFGWVKFDLPVAAIANVKTSLEKTPSILRHLIIKTVRENTRYSPKVAPGAVADVAPEAAADTEKKATGTEIDKSIDALVIS